MLAATNRLRMKQYVEVICDRSPRYAGTRGEAETRDYLAAEAAKIGDDVKLEEFDYLHYAPISSGLEILVPYLEALDHLPLLCAGNGTAEGEAVYAGSGTEEEISTLTQQGVSIKGKIVLISSGFPHYTYPIVQQHSAAAVVVLTDAPAGLCRAGTATSNFEKGKIPGVMVPAQVGQKLLLLQGTGKLKLRVTSKGIFSQKVSANVILTLPGVLAPDEVVMLVGHYDSHNLGKHAWDDAAGCAAMLEISRLIAQRKRVRTLKAIFFGVEELGLCWGSTSYIRKHRAEIPKVKAVVALDGMGCPYDLQFNLRASREAREFALTTIQKLGYPVIERALGQKPGPVADYEPFLNNGVPVIFITGEKPIYFHTARDDPETLDYGKLKDLADINAELVLKMVKSKGFPFGSG